MRENRSLLELEVVSDVPKFVKSCQVYHYGSSKSALSLPFFERFDTQRQLTFKRKIALGLESLREHYKAVVKARLAVQLVSAKQTSETAGLVIAVGGTRREHQRMVILEESAMGVEGNLTERTSLCLEICIPSLVPGICC